MATRVIDDTKLNDIAVAIQAKDSGGQMTVDEMPTRIANIPSGGGTLIQKTITENGIYNASSDNADGYDVVTVDVPQDIDNLIDGTITEIETNVTVIRTSAFMNLQSLNFIIAKNVISIGDSAFYGCGLSSINPFRFESCETIGFQAFRNMSTMQRQPYNRICLFPKLTTIAGNSFQSSNMYTGMTERILKQKCVLTSADVTGGYSIIYIPSALLSWYQNATNWVDRLNNYPNSIKTIEDNLSYLISRGYTEEELLKVEYDENEAI